MKIGRVLSLEEVQPRWQPLPWNLRRPRWVSEKLLFRGGTAIHATGLEAGKTERQWPSGSRLLASVSDGEPLDPPTLLVSPLPTPTPTGRLGETAGHAGAGRKRLSEVGCAGLCPRFGRPPDLRPLKPPGPGSGPDRRGKGPTREHVGGRCPEWGCRRRGPRAPGLPVPS